MNASHNRSPAIVDVDSYPMTPLQLGMLFHALQRVDSGVDIEQVICTLSEEDFDPAAFQHAWSGVVQRHTILRTAFRWLDLEAPVQWVARSVEVPFAIEDWSQRSALDQEIRWKNLLAADRRKGFQLHSPPLMRFHLVRWGARRWKILWTFHHALLDGRSFPVLLREAFALLRDNEAAASWAPAVPFREYVASLPKTEDPRSLDYWKDVLSGYSHPTSLGLSGYGATTPSEEGGYSEIGIELGLADSEVLRRFATDHGVTLNTILQAGWAILLQRYGGDQDVVFGVTRACRRSTPGHPDERVGLFINTLPLRITVDPEENLLTWLKKLRSQWTSMRDHEQVSLARVRHCSSLPSGLPVFETIVVADHASLNARMHSLGAEWASRQFEYLGQTNFAITVMAYMDPEIRLILGYDTSRFSELEIRGMLRHLRSLMLGMAAHPESTLGQLPLMGVEERAERVLGFNLQGEELRRAPRFSEKSTLHEIFETQALRSPDAIAVVCGERRLTYRELNDSATRWAARLQALGVGPDVLVGLCLDPSPELVIALLAILKAGGAYLPIDLAYPAERSAFMLADAKAPVLLTHSSLQARIPYTEATVLCLDQAPPESGNGTNGRVGNEWIRPATGPDHLAYVIYTSGTTGKPKGSLITHRNVVRLFSSTDAWFGFNESDSWSLFHSYAFDFSVWEIWGALLYGGKLVVVPFLTSRSPDLFYELLAQEKVTVLNQTPSAFRQLIAAEEAVGQKTLALRYVIFGGEALEMQSLRPWFDRHGDTQPRLVNMYGITETTVHVTYRPLSKDDLKRGSVIGVPIPDLQIYILDPFRQPVPVGVPGEMYVGGAGLARGYLHRPDLTDERFPTNFLPGTAGPRLYKTGDLARFLPGKDIEYLGRIDQQVKIRGFRIELGEIESVLLQHPAVRQVAVLAREEARGDKRLVAYVVAAATAPSVAELREHLKRQVPDYMVPAHFVFLLQMPLTNNGKLDRKALPAPQIQLVDSAAGFVAPVGDLEQKLADIWAKVIRVARVGRTDNFFELGGDSILSIQVVALARQSSLRITPAQLFKNQTVAELAAVATPIDAAPRISQEAVVGDVLPTPILRWMWEQDLAEPSYYNQAFLFQPSCALSSDVLERAMRIVESHHDALRLRVALDESGKPKALVHAAPSEKAPLAVVDLSEIARDEQARAIEQTCSRTQAELDWVHGPVWRVVHFNLGDPAASRLFLVLHHIVVDGVSWRILLEDLERAYLALESGTRPALPDKTTSFQEWSRQLSGWAASSKMAADLEYWTQLGSRPVPVLPIDHSTGENSEASTQVCVVSLDVAETESLLQRCHTSYRTQINDFLVGALAVTLRSWTGSSRVVFDMEGHGREDVFPGVDLSRTVGWFTSLYPVAIEVPEGGLTSIIPSVKEQLRRIPHRGLGYGVHRYLGNWEGWKSSGEPAVLFNYLGQLDRVTEGSALFSFARESVGPWHSPHSRRRYAVEINGWVKDGRMEWHWTWSRNVHRQATIEKRAGEFLATLKSWIHETLASKSEGATPSDFPLLLLSQKDVDTITTVGGRVDEVWPLSPLQTLFHTAASADPNAVVDQWHGTLLGPLDPERLKAAWRHAFQHHPILRASFRDVGTAGVVQVIRHHVHPEWTVESWDGGSVKDVSVRWEDRLASDRAQGLDLSTAPLSRFLLVRMGPGLWKWLWTVPALLLDGWSWPLVLRDVSSAYDALSAGVSPVLPAARSYGDYLAWLRNRGTDELKQYWSAYLKGVKRPTPLHAEPSGAERSRAGQFGDCALSVESDVVEAIQRLARGQQVTVNAVIQSAWSLVLSRLSGDRDVVFGAAFSGRSSELPGSEGIVGPFATNLPIRVQIDFAKSGLDLIKELNAQLQESASHQVVALAEVQSWSEVPWHARLFESLLVFQNYVVDDSARRVGSEVAIADFEGPIHTQYPLLVLVEPLANQQWRASLRFDRAQFSENRVQHWVQDFVQTLKALAIHSTKPVAELLEALTQPVMPAGSGKRVLRRTSQNIIAPQTDLERRIASVWSELFQIDEVGIEDNLFDMGAHSLLVVRLHQVLQERLDRRFPLVLLFQFPTIRALGDHLDPVRVEISKPLVNDAQDRAQLQRQAMARLRRPPISRDVRPRL